MADDFTYGLALPFDTDSGEFARGVEIGRLWEIVNATPEDEPREGEYVHASNAEMVMRIGEATNRQVVSAELDGHWLSVTFLAQRKDPHA
jgi:hypothetical protein